MADWKVPVPYNFNPAYHAFAYGLAYPPGTEQTHPNLNWTETSYNTGMNGGFYQTQVPQHSPPGSPEQMTPSATAPYPGSVMYFSDTHKQSGRLFLSQNHNLNQIYEGQRKENDRPSSDSEAHTPDSWSSSSSRETCLPPETPATWVKKEVDEVAVGDSPDGAVVSSSFSVVGEDECGLKDIGPAEEGSILKSPQAQLQTRKDKRRTVFSVGQMDALTHRFSVQRYLTPAEMKTLAGLTGLTYKQVKTWFQNRRMKLKRHQKEAWVSERYSNTGYPNAQPQFQADSQTILQDPYPNPQLRDAVFKKSPPNNVALYPNYMRPHSPPQATGHRPQSGWALPAAIAPQYEYPSQINLMVSSGNANLNTTNDANGANAGGSQTQIGLLHSATQWSS